jgi:hypothetical protein
VVEKGAMQEALNDFIEQGGGEGPRPGSNGHQWPLGRPVLIAIKGGLD